jgi:formylglycine-generating enzyme required for sulfatase activity
MKRYPGIRPFRTDEQALFFGRNADIARLYRLIDLEQVVILYGKSGSGKSSLLSAGIFPHLQSEGHRRYWEVRLGPYKPEESVPPSEALRQTLMHGLKSKGKSPLEKASPSLWLALKYCQTQESQHFLLVFDQFEEIFTYPEEQVLEFKKQLAEALYSKVPRRYAEALASAGLPDEEEDRWYRPFDLKVVFSIRSDRMSLLNALKDYLPNLLQNGYELESLTEHDAVDAVCQPAALKNGQFDTPPFSYAPETLEAIFKALQDERGLIETNALQIVCRYIEDNIVGRGDHQVIHPGYLGDIKSIFRAFYERTILSLPQEEQTPARRLVEDFLIKDGGRIPYASQALLILPDITQSILDQLASTSLLRVERDEQGRMLYEVGHDTLIAPITEVAEARHAEEEKLRLRQEAEIQRREKEKAERARRQARRVALGAIILSLFALGASGIAWMKTQEAREKTILAQRNRLKADQKTQEAEINLKQAEHNAKLAEEKRLEVEEQKDATLEQKRIAEKEAWRARLALLEVEKATVQVVINLLKESSVLINKMDYTAAADRLQNATELVRGKSGVSPLAPLKIWVADSLLEPAFFFAESFQVREAKAQTLAAARLLDHALPLLDDLTGNRFEDLERFRTTLHNLNPQAYARLKKRYYPTMLPVAGGEFAMGCDSTLYRYCGHDEFPRHRVKLNSFALAETEITNFQFGLFGASEKRDPLEAHHIPWGPIRGSDPVINVSWFDAIDYANWLSRQHRLNPIYTIEKGKPVSWDIEANGYGLPTEAQWEYAARGGPHQRPFLYAGVNADSLNAVSWWNGNSNRTNPVGLLKPNSAGFFDLSGNVWEWCWDCYSEGYYANSPDENPKGPNAGDNRTLRGGSWNLNDTDCRLTLRLSRNPLSRYNNFGFRVARSK